VTTIADDYRSRFIQGQIDTIKEAKETSPGMLNFLSVPEEKDVFVHPEQIGIDYKNLYGEPRSGRLGGMVTTPYAPVFGSDPNPHPREVTLPWLQQGLTEKSVLDVPTDDPSWQTVTAKEGKLGIMPDAPEHVLAHEQIHLDIIDLVGSGHLDSKVYRALNGVPGMEEALIDYMLFRAGVGDRKNLDKFLRFRNKTLEEMEGSFETYIDFLNDARRSERGSKRNVGPAVDYPAQQYTGKGGHLGLFPKLEIIEDSDEGGLTPKIQGMMDDLIKRGPFFWSNEQISDIYGTTPDFVEKRRQDILRETTAPEATPDAAAGPAFLPGRKSVGEATEASNLLLQQWDEGAEEGYSEGNLAEVGTYSLGTDTVKAMGLNPWYKNRAMLDPKAATSFKTMEKDFGGTIKIESAFRSEIHNDALRKLGLKASETSNHLDGLSIDVSEPFALKWLKANGKQYGWEFGRHKDNKHHFNFVGI
jgi:hypothetical protein